MLLPSPECGYSWLRDARDENCPNDPGKPWQNGANESFSDRFLDECFGPSGLATALTRRLPLTAAGDTTPRPYVNLGFLPAEFNGVNNPERCFLAISVRRTQAGQKETAAMIANTAQLAEQIARIGPIPRAALDSVCAEVLRADTPWVEHYRDYQSGGWWTASLLNDSGDPGDVQIRDGAGRATTLLRSMPRTQELIEGLGLKIMWVRLAKLTSNSFLWEHVDYRELREAPRYRLHIPLTTNSSARLVIAGRSLNLTVGHVWRLAPVHPHGVCNLYGPDRLHIVIDCYENSALHTLMAQSELRDEEAPLLPTADESTLQRAVREAGALLDLGMPEAAEQTVLRLFFRYSLPAGRPYDLLAELHAERGLAEAAVSWKQRRTALLGEQA